jgi:hypothetical protein
MVREGGLPYFIALLRSNNEQAQEHASVLMQNLSMDATNQVCTDVCVCVCVHINKEYSIVGSDEACVFMLRAFALTC